jgi:hypothetical protein
MIARQLLAKTAAHALMESMSTIASVFLDSSELIAKPTLTSACLNHAKTVQHALMALMHTLAHAPKDSQETTAKSTSMIAHHSHARTELNALT